MQCVVPENIHTPRPPTEGNGSSEGRWSPKGGNFRGGGVASRVFCLGALSKIDEQAISYSGGSREGGPHLFVDQTEAQRAKKVFLETAAPPPPYLRVWMSAPPYLKLCIRHSIILLLNGLSKQKVLFSSTICYLRLAECFFHGLHDSLCKAIVGN